MDERVECVRLKNLEEATSEETGEDERVVVLGRAAPVVPLEPAVDGRVLRGVTGGLVIFAVLGYGCAADIEDRDGMNRESTPFWSACPSVERGPIIDR